MEYWESYNKPPPKKKRKIRKGKQKDVKTKMFKLVWLYMGEERNELIRGDYGLCLWKKRIENINYKQGFLKIIPII